MNIDIEHGRVRVNQVRHHIDSLNVHVFEVDLASKYPGQVQWMENADGDGMDVFLFHTARTRDLNDQTTEDTLIRITGFDAGNFTGVAEASRYTARLVFYRRTLE